MNARIASNSMSLIFLASAAFAAAATASIPKAEDSGAAAQYKQLHFSSDPAAAAAGTYQLDPHHTSVLAKLAHMNLSRYTLRFDKISGSFQFDPSTATATRLHITIDPTSVDTGDPAFDKRIATKFFESDKFPAMTYTAEAVKIIDGHVAVMGVLDFHGVKKQIVLNTTYRGVAQSRMGFSGEATFKRSDFGVSQWVPLEADDVMILVETEFVKP